LARAVEGFRADVKRGLNEEKGSLALALVMLATHQLNSAENLANLRTMKVLKTTDIGDTMIAGFFYSADGNVHEALTYDERLVDAAALSIEIEAEQFIYNQQNQKDTAGNTMTVFIDQAKALCQKFPQSVVALETLSEVLQLNKSLKEAAESLNIAITIEPLNVDLYIHRAQAEVEKGNCAAARIYIANAVSLAGKGAQDFEFQEQIKFGPHNKCVAAGIR
jgi:tetratricopeptide (TPR) repeat protein